MFPIKNILKFAFICLSTLIISGSQMNNQKHFQPKTYIGLGNEVTNTFIKEVQEEFGFKCWGCGGSMPYDVEGIDVAFAAYRKATIDEARELEVMLIEKLLRIINSHEKIRPYLREYPFTGERANVMISFYDKKNHRQIKNSIALVFQARNKIFYNVGEPKTEKLIDLAEESYDDALKIVQDKQSKQNSTH